jgi:hypothetical protein
MNARLDPRIVAGGTHRDPLSFASSSWCASGVSQGRRCGIYEASAGRFEAAVLFHEVDNDIDALAGFQIGENERAFSAHSFCVSVHHFQARGTGPAHRAGRGSRLRFSSSIKLDPGNESGGSAHYLKKFEKFFVGPAIERAGIDLLRNNEFS